MSISLGILYSSPNQAKKPEKSREKVAETTEIPKTAPQTQPKKSQVQICV